MIKTNIIEIEDVEIGKGFTVIGGPCAIESKKQLFKTAEKIKDNTNILRGGAFKPRTSPDSFQGLGEKGLKLLKKAGDKFNLPTITEVMDPKKVELVSKYTDILQIGARNMQNYPLLKKAGKNKKPMLLKRGFSSTLKEWLGSAKYITNQGNKKVILCERGIRTFNEETRFTLDLATAYLAKIRTNFPVIIDPSHSTGDPKLIPAMVKASQSAGFSGVMVETHYKPKKALCDADQALTCERFNKLFGKQKKQ